MSIQHLHSLRAHGEWADQRLVNALLAATIAVPDAVRELAHIKGAQEVWLARIQQRTPTLAVWPALTLSELHAAGAAIDAAQRLYFETLHASQLDTRINYSNTAGTAFSTPLGEILLHMLMHGQYHRGKVNVALRAAGLDVVGLDYILWQREQTESP